MSTPILSASARALRPSVFAELAPRIQALGSECIPLHIGDTYRLPPEAALNAVRRVAKEELESTSYFKYTHPFGRPELIEALTEKLRRDNGMEVGSDQIQVTNGATQGLAAVAQTLLDPGDEVIVLCPHWPLIRGVVETVGGVVVEASYSDAIEDPKGVLTSLVSDRTRAIYFANPNNPDGQLVDAKRAESLYEFAAAHGLYLLSDEAYEHIVFDGNERVSVGALDNDADSPRVISVFTFSKSFGMAGMRVGYVTGPVEVMRSLRSVSTHQIYDLSALSQELAIAILSQSDEDYRDYLSEQNKVYQEARDLLASAFEEVPIPAGGAYLYVPFADYKMAREAMFAWLDRGVSSAPGEAFGGRYAHCLRLCFTAIPMTRLAEAVAIIKAVGSVA